MTKKIKTFEAFLKTVEEYKFDSMVKSLCRSGEIDMNNVNFIFNLFSTMLSCECSDIWKIYVKIARYMENEDMEYTAEIPIRVYREFEEEFYLMPFNL